jgi:alpha-glucosidase
VTGEAPWWRGGVIYQVYPRSFADGNGDGIGDLDGLTARIGHIASLGADAVWLNPIQPSGGVDGGYDIVDYLGVDSDYGGIDAFGRFVEAAHARGLRVILDFVPNHTSDRHPWFLDARSDPLSPKRSWYVFAGGRDGGPPNNWASRFFGPSWVRDDASGQWYLASFYPQQPDLNWHNPDVRRAMTDVLRTWTSRGVDGFRIDVIHRLAKDPSLRDNPPEAPGALGDEHRSDPWTDTGHVFDEDGPEVHGYIREMRDAVGHDRLLLGEVWLLDLHKVVPYLASGELDLAFNFPFALSPWNARAMGAAVDLAEQLYTDVWPTYHLSNHDMPRHPTRYGERSARAAALLLLTLRGTAVLYQGEEIGMVDGDVPRSRRTDRMGRDGCRTPMQWDGSTNAGFCPPDAQPWLPVADGHQHRNVSAEEGDPDSILALYRRLLTARRRHSALAVGSYLRLDAPDGCLAYERKGGDERFVVAINFTEEPCRVTTGEGVIAVATSTRRVGERVPGPVILKGNEAVVLRTGSHP